MPGIWHPQRLGLPIKYAIPRHRWVYVLLFETLPSVSSGSPLLSIAFIDSASIYSSAYHPVKIADLRGSFLLKKKLQSSKSRPGLWLRQLQGLSRHTMFSRRPSQSKTESFSKKNESFSKKGRVVKNSFREHTVSKNRYEERPRTRKPPTEEPVRDK